MENHKEYKSIKDIRRENLKKIVDMNGGHVGFLSRYAHLYDERKPLSSSMLSQLVNGVSSFGDNVAAKIEDMVGKPRYWMDNDHSNVKYMGVPWPFPITYEEYMGLDNSMKTVIEVAMISVLASSKVDKKTAA